MGRRRAGGIFWFTACCIMAAWHKACLGDEKLSREQPDNQIKNWLVVWLAGKRAVGKKSKAAPMQSLSPPPAAMSKVARDTQDLQEKNAFKMAQIQEAELNQQAQKFGVGAAGPSADVPSTPCAAGQTDETISNGPVRQITPLAGTGVFSARVAAHESRLEDIMDRLEREVGFTITGWIYNDVYNLYNHVLRESSKANLVGVNPTDEALTQDTAYLRRTAGRTEFARPP